MTRKAKMLAIVTAARAGLAILDARLTNEDNEQGFLDYMNAHHGDNAEAAVEAYMNVRAVVVLAEHLADYLKGHLDQQGVEIESEELADSPEQAIELGKRVQLPLDDMPHIAAHLRRPA